MRLKNDKGGRCLAGAMNELCLLHAELNRDAAVSYLVEALPEVPKRKA